MELKKNFFLLFVAAADEARKNYNEADRKFRDIESEIK